MSQIITEYQQCRLCPRECLADRYERYGVCRSGAVPSVNLYMAHFGEEPPISGTNGSGAVFFEGCPLHCMFCQNKAVSDKATGKGMLCDEEELVRIWFELKEKGVHNINLVTPLHYAPHIARAIGLAKDRGIGLPFVINCGGYESVETIKMLDGLADIYLPDFKFWDSRLSRMVTGAADYRERAIAAIDEMFSQTGPFVLDPKTGLMKRGMIVRHLMLPAKLFDTKKIIDYLTERYGNDIFISLMNQYTPMPHIINDPRAPDLLKRKVPSGHYAAAVDYLAGKGQVNAFIQEEDASGDVMIPGFIS